MEEPKIKLGVIVGPTASGKTALAVEMARRFDGEIVSADSMQIYQGMPVSTACPTPEEKGGIPHHMLEFLPLSRPYSVAEYVKDAAGEIRRISERGKLPILVGGTGFYIQAVTRDIDFTQAEQDDGYRAGLETLVQEKGAAYLHQMLAEVDPKSAEVIHENNTKRVIRALEFYHQNHSPISAHNEEQQERTSPYNLAYFVLNAPRELLYKRIDKRVDEMMTSGLVAEVQKLKDMGYHRGMVSMQGLGYKEILAYLDGEMPLEEAVRILKRDTRHFAKRQLTWFRREPETVWVNKDEFGYDENKMLEYMLSVCHEKGITGE